MDIEDAANLQGIMAETEGTDVNERKVFEILLDQHIRGTGRVFVARSDGRVLGCIAVAFMPSYSSGIVSGLVCLPGAPPYTALRLMDVAAHEIRSRGFVGLWATINTKRNRERRTYAAMGFKPVGKSKEGTDWYATTPDAAIAALAERLN